MNPQEALKVLRKVIAYQPNQRVDELTPEAWAEALEPYYLSDALAVVKDLALAPRSEYRPPFIEIGDIVNELEHVERRRMDERWADAKSLMPHFPLVEDERGYVYTSREEIEWLRNMRQATRDPDWKMPEQPQREELPARPVESLVKQIGQIRNGGHPPVQPAYHCPGCTCEAGEPT